MQTARRHLKYWLVPHKGNRHHPHLIRPHGLAIIAVLVLSLQLTWNISVTGHPAVLGYASDITVADLVAQTNQQRTTAGLAALHEDSRLDNGAAAKAQDMFANNYWAHVSPSGVQPWYWFDQAGYHYIYAGENLAKDFDTTSGVMAGWMASPDHKSNILNVHYTDVGFAVMNGTLQGSQTTLVVAFYGSMQDAAPVAAASATATTTAATPPPRAATTPNPTPTPTSVPTAAPVLATPTPLAHPATAATQTAPAKSYGFLHPLGINHTLNWAAWVTLLLLLAGFGVSVATNWAVHHLPRRSRRIWWRHHSLYTAVVFAVVAVAVIMASFGSVA